MMKITSQIRTITMPVNVKKETSLSVLILFSLVMSGCAKIGHIVPVPVPPPPPPSMPIVPSSFTVHVEATTPDLSQAETFLPIMFDGALLDQDVPRWGREDFFFKVWRPPLDKVGLSGNQLTIDLQTYFYLAIRDPYDPLFQCGFKHQRALHRVIHLKSSLTWGAKWKVQSQTESTMDPPDSTCILGFIKYDATHFLDGAILDGLKMGTSRLDEAIGRQTDKATQAADMWNQLKATKKVGSDLWVRLQPSEVVAGGIKSVPTSDHGFYRMATDFSLIVHPRFDFGAKPPDDLSKLPDLTVSPAIEPRVDLHPELHLEINEATNLLRGKFPIVVNYGKHQIQLTEPRVMVSGNKLMIVMNIHSGVNRIAGRGRPIISAIRNGFMGIEYAILGKMWNDDGQIVVEATPLFDNNTRDVYSSDLDFDLQSKNALLKAVEWVFHTPLLEIVRKEARWNFGEKEDSLRSSLNSEFNQNLGSAATISGYIDSIRGDVIFTERLDGSDFIDARMHVTGDATVTVH